MLPPVSSRFILIGSIFNYHLVDGSSDDSPERAEDQPGGSVIKLSGFVTGYFYFGVV